MISLGLPQSAQNANKTVADDLRLKIATLEAESQAYQTVYKDLVQEMKAKLEQSIREVKEGVKI